MHAYIANLPGIVNSQSGSEGLHHPSQRVHELVRVGGRLGGLIVDIALANDYFDPGVTRESNQSGCSHRVDAYTRGIDSHSY